MHHRHKDPNARDAGRQPRRFDDDDARGRRERYDFGDENRGEPYYNELYGGRFGEPRGPAYAEDIERGAGYGGGEPGYRPGARASEGGRGQPEYGAFGPYGEYRGGGRWTASPDLPRHLVPAGPMAGTDVSYQRGAYYYGPRGEEDRRGDYRYRGDDERYDPYGRDLGANWTRPAPYSGYVETQGHSARGVENYSGRGPKGYARSDARIQEEVCERLTDDARVDATDIVIATKNGVVTLDGTVPQRWMKHCAEDVTENCGGVKDVVNRLSVRRDDGSVSSNGDAAKKH